MLGEVLSLTSGFHPLRPFLGSLRASFDKVICISLLEMVSVCENEHVHKFSFSQETGATCTCATCSHHGLFGVPRSAALRERWPKGNLLR